MLLNRDAADREAVLQRVRPAELVLRRRHLREPEQPEERSTTRKRRLQLLAEAGWKDRDAQGRLVKNGQPLALELLYGDKGIGAVDDDLPGRAAQGRHRPEPAARHARDAVQAGDGAQVRHGRSMGWGGLLFPNPETSFASTLADVPNNNNITGFKDKRVDELLDAYDGSSIQQKRAAIIQEIDGILANSYQYILGWDAPFERIAYWNKFGHPEGYLTRIGDYRDIADRSGGSIRRRTRSCGARWATTRVNAAGRRRPRCATGPSTAEREKAAAAGQMTGVFRPAVPADHPDLHRDHARRVRRHAVRAGRPGRTADHALPDGRDDRRAAPAPGVMSGRGEQCAARGADRGDPALLRLRQAGARPLRHVALERAAPRPRQLVHLPGSGLGRHQVAVPGLDLPRAHRVPPELPGLRAARRVQGGAPRLALRFRQQRRSCSSATRCRAGRSARRCSCSSAAAASGVSSRSAASGPTTGST